MVFISKNDKKAWQDYIDNFEHFTLNLKKDDLKKEVKIKRKILSKKIISLILINYLKKVKSNLME